ncbi:WD40/YVTN/BNR-like repeat-containing protein [Natrinema salifodinae]|uniref:Uncharacterized protein n=1 Tax=Natrinema salifodinae TaxID=1202768 RepID=A0A1I0PLB4_9EURY|nr:hypothetical protein [Natrinema salifodinae]SEW15041.1 hypothetical protein SAMN05216285_2683 [Natrinema salifodinae]
MATSTNDSGSGDGFVPFFRRYTKTWIHAVATAGLTAFGTLTIVHRWFVVLALASYVVPPVVLYLRQARSARDRAGDEDAAASTDRTDREPTGRESEAVGARDPARDVDREPKPGTETEPAAPDRAAAATETGERDEPAGTDEPVKSAQTAETAETAGTTATDATAGLSETDESTSTGARPDESESEGEGESGDGDRTEPVGWHPVDTPTEATLRDVSVTKTGPYAVGDGGVVIAADRGGGRTVGGDGSDDWTVVLADGPGAAGSDLRGVDATADGEVVWVAGDSGAVGRIETETGRHTDYTAPDDITDNWLGVAVGGPSGDETVLLINGSGAVCRGRYRDGEPSWDDPVKPGSGSSLSGVALADASVGYCCDTNDGVFETTDGGDSFARVGIDGADGTLSGVATAGRSDCLVSADDGVVHRYDGSTWTPERVSDGALSGLARRTGDDGDGGDRDGETIACGAGGEIYERRGATAWERVDADAPGSLLAVSLAPEGSLAVAVGEDGTAVERRGGG